MRTIRIKLYRFSELSKEAQDKAVNTRINNMIKYEYQDHYENWPEFKRAMDTAEDMKTPWFAGSYVWDYCKDIILEQLNDTYFEFTKDGKLS